MAEIYSKKVMDTFLNPHNMGKIKHADGVGKVGNPICVLPDTAIQANINICAMEDIEPERNLLSHDGRFHKVAKKFKRTYGGKIINLKNRLGSVSVTPEHEILAIKVPRSQYYSRIKNKVKLKPAWYHAQELEKGDIALYPILKEKIDVNSIKVDNKKLKFDFKSKTIPKELTIDDDFLRLSGYYLSEGCLIDKVTKTHISFTFNIKEKEYADDVINIVERIFGLKAKKRVLQNQNTIIVTVNNVMFVRLLKKLFGKGAVSKSIPDFMMLLDPEKQKSLIIGLWCGDGHVSTNRRWPRAGFTTISPKLCQQVKVLLMRQKIIPSIYVEEEKIVRGTRHRKAYRVHVGNRHSVKKLADIMDIKVHFRPKERNDIWYDDDYIYVPITNISTRKYEGFVHNLKIEESASYCSDAFTLHNCGDVMHLYIKVENNKIVDIKFQTFGCAAAIATSSMITDMAKGKTLEEAMKITRKDVSDELGGLPPIKEHCSNLSADALHAAIEDYKKKAK